MAERLHVGRKYRPSFESPVGAWAACAVVDRNVLEWRLDPTRPHRLVAADPPDRAGRPIVLVRNEGYDSSLAAAGLLDLGLTNATDLDGGVQAWVPAPHPRSRPENECHPDPPREQ